MPRHATKVSVNYLNSNATSHVTPASAIAELADNSYDAKATNLAIDVDTVNERKVLIISDDGYGMSYEGLKGCLNLGYSNTSSSNRRAIGRYGNGFKSSFRRLGKNVLLLSKQSGSDTVAIGLYSEQLLQDSADDELAFFTAQNLLTEDDSDPDLKTIIENSFINDKSYFTSRYQSWTANNSMKKVRKSCTMIFIWDLDPTLDFSDSDDIRLHEKSFFNFLRPKHEMKKYSIRCYLKYIYRVPKMVIYLRNKRIVNNLPHKELSNKSIYEYKPRFVASNVEVRMILGFDSGDYFDDYRKGGAELSFYEIKQGKIAKIT